MLRGARAAHLGWMVDASVGCLMRPRLASRAVNAAHSAQARPPDLQPEKGYLGLSRINCEATTFCARPTALGQHYEADSTKPTLRSRRCSADAQYRRVLRSLFHANYSVILREP